MDKMKDTEFQEFIKTLGISNVIKGVIVGNDVESHLLMLPDKTLGDTINSIDKLSTEDWEVIFKQMDYLQIEVTQGEKLPKIILRKSQRNIEQRISWEVYRRDNFTCRYCGTRTVPLTVDHLRTWEEGGPSIKENLVTCCKKCNRNRGNTPYEEWLNSDYYKKVSENIPKYIKDLNESLIESIKDIPLLVHRKRR